MSEISTGVMVNKNEPSELFIHFGDGEDVILRCHTPENAERFRRYLETTDDEEARELLKNFDKHQPSGGDHECN